MATESLAGARRRAATPGRVLTYSGGRLDRASAQRTDPAWIAAALADPAARVLPLWRDACLVAGEPAEPVRPAVAAAGELLAAADEPVFLGIDGAGPVFAADLSALDEPRAVEVAGAERTADVRTIVAALAPDDAATVAYARGLLYWHRHQRFCGTCGAPAERRHGGHLRVCTGDGCGRWLFPRIEPAVIMLVEAPASPGTPDRCLLARHRGAPEGSYSTLAGFVEIGESLEDAVCREVAEEAGVELASVRYEGSQAWPFPAGLMVAFRAVAASDTVAPDHDELDEARWFTRSELTERLADRSKRGLLRHDSVESFLITSWLDEGR